MLLACGSRHQFQIPPTAAGGVICYPVHLPQNAYIISQGDGHRNIGPIADYNTGIGNINPALVRDPQRIPAREIQPPRPYLVIGSGSRALRCPNGSIVATPGMWSVTRRSSVGAAWVVIYSSAAWPEQSRSAARDTLNRLTSGCTGISADACNRYAQIRVRSPWPSLRHGPWSKLNIRRNQRTAKRVHPECAAIASSQATATDA